MKFAIQNALAICDSHNNVGGSSYSFSEESIVSAKGYALSIFPEFSEKVANRFLSPKRVLDYVTRNQDVLTHPSAILGTWYNEAERRSYIDISLVVHDQSKAVYLAQLANQIAIYDFVHRCDIPANGTEKPIGKSVDISNISSAFRIQYLQAQLQSAFYSQD